MSTVVKDLGAVSAYAYAVEKGYTGTEAEFAELMADYAEVGQRAEDAADSALESKTAAQTAATTATNKASEATTAAQTATTKAAEAQADADAAALDASQALSAASTATTKATEATTAAATAVSAKDDAVSANTAAQSAKTAAQTAQAGAETAAASVQESAEQIATNTEDIGQLKNTLTQKTDLTEFYSAFPTDTASGTIASFTDGAELPLKSLTVDIEPVQDGTGDPSPDNVRPISGHTQAVVTGLGKNLLNSTDIPASTSSTKFENLGLASNNYVISFDLENVTFQNLSSAILDLYDLDNNNFAYPIAGQIKRVSDNASLSSLTQPVTGRFYYKITSHSLSKIIVLFTSESYSQFTGTMKNLLLEVGSSATDYEAYTEQTDLTVDWTDEAGTVYGGTLDVLSGKLVIDRAMVDFGTLNWVYNLTTEQFRAELSPAPAEGYATIAFNAICTQYPIVPYNSIADKTASVFYASVNGINIKDSAYTDATVFKSAMSGVQLVYEVANPTTIQLTPHEVTALLGSNNIWADTGDTAVEYRADPTLYIGRLTEPDADMIADANITSGQYFMVGNTLYKATANIASGGAITPNVNCTRKSLSEALNELNV